MRLTPNRIIFGTIGGISLTLFVFSFQAFNLPIKLRNAISQKPFIGLKEHYHESLTTTIQSSSSSQLPVLSLTGRPAKLFNDTISAANVEFSNFSLEISNATVAQPLIIPTDICQKRPKLIVAVLTLPADHQIRQMVRDNITYFNQKKVLPVFPLGRPDPHAPSVHAKDPKTESLAVEKAIYEEARRYGDIILANFADKYVTLATKTMTVFEWFGAYCQGEVKWLLKVDIDVTVNWSTLLAEIQAIEEHGIRNIYTAKGKQKTEHLSSHENAVWVGHRWDSMAVIKDPDSRNYEDLDRDLYPPYCSGPAYLMNDRVVQIIVAQRDKDRRYYRNEDAMLGILLEGLVMPVHTKKVIVFSTDSYRMDACGKSTKSISECNCSSWWSYQCGDNESEHVASGKEVKRCAVSLTTA